MRPLSTILALTALLALTGCSGSSAGPSAAGRSSAVPSSTATDASDDPSEATDTDETPRPDTVVYGFITSNTTTSLSYDKVDFLEKACRTLDGVEPGKVVAAVRTCFRNTSPQERTLQVSPEVIVTPYSGEGDLPPVGIDRLANYYGTQDDDVPPGAEVWKISTNGGLVVSLEQFPLGVLAP
jgi:hypothetical protein